MSPQKKNNKKKGNNQLPHSALEKLSLSETGQSKIFPVVGDVSSSIIFQFCLPAVLGDEIYLFGFLMSMNTWEDSLSLQRLNFYVSLAQQIWFVHLLLKPRMQLPRFILKIILSVTNAT